VRRLLVIVTLAAALLVALAITRAAVRERTTEELSMPAFVAMARSIGLVGDRDVPCGPLPADADDALRRIDVDCRVSQRMAELRDALDSCTDAACARAVAPELVDVAQQAEAIERRFAHDLRGDCRTFFTVEADYDRGIAQAADPLRAIPGDAFFGAAHGAWLRDSIATANAIDRQPVTGLLAACHPTG